MAAAPFNDGPFDLSTLTIEEYEALFHQYYQWLCLQACKITGSWAASEDIVQEFFARCWQNRQSIQIRENWKGFAARSVKNAALNYLKKENIRAKHENAAMATEQAREELPAAAQTDETDLRYLQIIQAVNNLPEQRRKALLLSRQQNMKYTEIATELGISVNTVKMHIRLAYQELREALKSIMIFFYFF